VARVLVTRELPAGALDTLVAEGHEIVQRRMARMAAQAVRAVLAGERPANVVNPEVFG